MMKANFYKRRII